MRLFEIVVIIVLLSVIWRTLILLVYTPEIVLWLHLAKHSLMRNTICYEQLLLRLFGILALLGSAMCNMLFSQMGLTTRLSKSTLVSLDHPHWLPKRPDIHLPTRQQKLVLDIPYRSSPMP